MAPGSTANGVAVCCCGINAGGGEVGACCPPGDPGKPPGDPGKPPGDPGKPPGDPGKPPGDPGKPPGDPGKPPGDPGKLGDGNCGLKNLG